MNKESLGKMRILAKNLVSNFMGQFEVTEDEQALCLASYYLASL